MTLWRRPWIELTLDGLWIWWSYDPKAIRYARGFKVVRASKFPVLFSERYGKPGEYRSLELLGLRLTRVHRKQAPPIVDAPA